jgi:hypothetical protein
VQGIDPGFFAPQVEEVEPRGNGHSPFIINLLMHQGGNGGPYPLVNVVEQLHVVE